MNSSTFWDITVPRLMTLYANAIFALLWVGFFVALIVNREWLDIAWTWVQSLPMILRIPAWVFLTPVMVLLWVWQSSWPVLWKAAGFAGLIGWTLIAVWNIFRTFR